MSGSWYYAENGKPVGPLSLSELVERLSACANANSELVWRNGFPDWKRVGDVVELSFAIRPPPLPESRTSKPIEPSIGENEARHVEAHFDELVPAPRSVSRDDAHEPEPAPEKTATTKRKFDNFIARNWRGEFPLWVSYWILGLIGNLGALAFAVSVSTLLADKNGYNPISIFATLTAVWIGILSIVTWQVVGVWRSSARYMAEKKKTVWGTLARLAIIFGVIRAVLDFFQSGYPQIEEATKMAFLNDPRIPDYALRIMRNGTEIEISGGFKFGLYDDLVRLLKAAPQVKVVHLNSVGGRIGEATKIYRTIRSHGLSTYTAQSCNSACTVAFAAGRERWLSVKGKLGFHAPAFPGLGEQELRQEADVQRQLMLESGITAGFISKALSTPSTSLWQPSKEELLDANVITGIADQYKFAVSGYGPNIKRDEMATQFHKIPLYAALEKVNPRAVSDFVDEFYNGYIAGEPEGSLIDVVRAKIYPVVISYRALADDPTVIEVGKLTSVQLKALAAKDKKLCYAYASGSTGNLKGVAQYLPSELIEQEMAVNERVLRTAALRPKVDQRRVEEGWEIIGSRLRSRFGNKVQLLNQKELAPTEQADFCDISIATYEEILKLPSGQAAMLLRSSFEQ